MRLQLGVAAAELLGLAVERSLELLPPLTLRIAFAFQMARALLELAELGGLTLQTVEKLR